MQQAVKLLQMSSLDFTASMQDALSQNPFLEAGEDGEAHDASLPAAAPDPDAATDASDRDLWHSDRGSGLRRADDGEHSAMESMAVQPTLNDALHTQINVLVLTERDRALARTVIESLDDDGYLRTPLDELLDVPGLLPPPTLREMENALSRVQLLEPAGVGARTVAECLLLQMPAIDCPQTREMATTIVQHHLGALASRDMALLATRLGAPVAAVQKACERIRHLDPRPGWRVGPTPTDYIVPDLTVRRTRGGWAVQLNPAVVPKMRLNQVYAALFQRHRTPLHNEMGDHLQQARWTLRNMAQRFATILDVAQAIVKRQAGFLDYGPMAMKPLCLKEVAQEVGVHESTVCRATNNKYIATPAGVFELKYFFSRVMLSASGQACSGTAIRGLVKSLLDGENPSQPLSDAEVARLLAAQGLAISRRTVTKYRQTMKIDAAERRRRHAQEVTA